MILKWLLMQSLFLAIGVNSESTPDDDRSNYSGCQIPNDLQGLTFKLHPFNNTMKSGEWLQDSETLHIECSNKGKLEGPAALICEKGEFKSPFPKCNYFCDKTQLEGLSTEYNVFYKNRYIHPSALSTGIPPNSRIEVMCATGYKRKSNSLLKHRTRQVLRCLPNGMLDQEREKCILDCGHPMSANVPLSNAGIPTVPSRVPWHVAIFKQENGKYKYICGGSIVSHSTIISAAHCFWDADKRLPISPENYRFIAGKYNKEYNTPDDNDITQMREAKSIEISDRFDGMQQLNYADIAVIRMKSPLNYNENISAICMPPHKGNGDDYIPFDVQGSVTGYGPQNTLQRVDMVTLDLFECRKEQEEHDLAADKFCLRNDGISTICRGDSGGGFFRDINKSYYLLGVISYSPSTVNDCARNSLVTVTNVRYMTKDLMKILTEQLHKDNELN